MDVTCATCAYYHNTECRRFPTAVRVRQPEQHWCGEHRLPERVVLAELAENQRELEAKPKPKRRKGS